MKQRLINAILLALLGFSIGACERKAHSVRYVVAGSAGSIAVEYRNTTGGAEQRNVAAPWELTVERWTGDYSAITVFNPTPTGTVSCQVFVDGVLVQEAQSEGGYKAAHCGTLAGVAWPTPTPQP